jgi:hypothetical protein
MTKPRLPESKSNQRGILIGIMLALAAWGIFLALGAYWYGYDPQHGNITYSPNPLRGLIVLACAALFLGMWNLLLSRRR